MLKSKWCLFSAQFILCNVFPDEQAIQFPETQPRELGF
jgi:hypothetical protein